MSDRTRRILAWIVAASGAVLLAYVVFQLALMWRGDLGPGPLRLLTLLANTATGAALVFLGWLTLRSLRPRP